MAGVVAASPPAPARPARRTHLALDLTLLAIVGVLLVAAVGAGIAALYREFYSPTAFVERYLALIAADHAADALALPGVAVDADSLAAAGLPASVSPALLRPASLGTLSGVTAVGEQTTGGVTAVTVEYRAGSYPGRTTFQIERDGWIGVVPSWRFASSPLAVMDVTVRGSMRFQVNGFEVDKRQVSPDGLDADPLAAISMLVFTPGVYTVSVDTPISSTAGASLLADAPQTAVPVDVQAQPTQEFVDVVQKRVDDFLSDCTTQQVLQPTACPFGYVVDNRIEGLPHWTISQQPTVTVAPDGANWRIPATAAVAHLEVDIRSLFDGSLSHLSEDVPFMVDGSITVLPDGSASIVVGAP